jgi:hypothetical protein
VSVSIAGKSSRVRRAERWAIIEWLRVRRWLVLLTVLVLALALSAGGLSLLSVGVSHLNKSESRTFIHRQDALPNGSEEAPIIQRVPPEH